MPEPFILRSLLYLAIWAGFASLWGFSVDAMGRDAQVASSRHIQRGIENELDSDTNQEQFAISLFETLAHTGLAEGASSHGQTGMRFSVGLAQFHKIEEDVVQNGGPGIPAGGEPKAKRLWLTRGLYWPINIGLNLNSLDELNWLSVTGFTQWTVYEALAHPAISLRGLFTLGYGLERSKFQSTGLEATISQGFFRYFSIFLSQGWFQNETSTTRLSISPMGGALMTSDPQLGVRNQFTTVKRARTFMRSEAGMQFVIVPGLAGGAYSWSVLDEKRSMHTVKLSLVL